MSKFFCALTAAAAAFISTASAAATFSFDDIISSKRNERLPSPYLMGGLEWANWGLAYVGYLPGTGYVSGVVSGEYSAYNVVGEDAKISASSTFEFNSLYATAGFNSTVQLTILGFLNNTLVETTTLTLIQSSPTFIDLNWTVDEIVFSGAGEFMSFDDLTINAAPTTAVPVPAALPLMLAGLGGLVALRRRG